LFTYGTGHYRSLSSFPTRRSSDLVLLKIMEEHDPDGRDRGGERHLFGIEKLIERSAVELRARHDQTGARHRSGKGKRPGIGMKQDRKSTRLNSSHLVISYAVFCLK